MTLLGLHDGVALRFDEATLSAIELGRFARTYELHETVDPEPGLLGTPHPYLPLETSLDMSDARFRGLDPYSGRQVRQPLAGGHRTLSVMQGQAAPGAGLADVILARARIDASLAQPIVWRLTAPSDVAWESDESGAEAYLGKGCTVRVSSTSPLAIQDGHTLRVDFPAGPSSIEIWLEASPPTHLAPAVVIASARQMREAAIVASAIGSSERSYIPIFDLEMPPASGESFQADNNRLGQLAGEIGQLEEQMRQVAQKGAQAPSGLVLPGVKSAEQSLEQLTRQREDLLKQMDPLQQRVLAYANWSRRTTILSRLLASLTAGSRESPHLFILAPYPVMLLQDWSVSAEMTLLAHESSTQQAAAWQSAVGAALPDKAIDFVYWKDAQDLATQVWTRTHEQTQPAFFTIPDDPAFYPVGLLDALRRGRALLPRGRPGTQVNLEQIQDTLNAGNESEHAVIVEADNSISTLIGVLYAHHMGARLYVNPLPRLEQAFDRMRAITENFQREQLAALAANAYRYIGEHRKEFMQSQGADPQFKQVAAGLSVLELPVAVPTPYSDASFMQALTTYLTAQQAGAQQGYRYDDEQWSKDLHALEAEVSAGVSEYIRKAVGPTSRVTVFTGGMPYSLANGFEGKAVALVLRDVAATFILRHIAQAGAGQPALSLALTVDPGLQPRAAPDIPELVDRTIALRGPAASLTNLAMLASLVPLRSLLLHTQGSLDTIILSDARNQFVQVHADELAGQLQFGSSPLAMYSAPLGWLSMGLALLEQGAGGFVGTLWPVDDSTGEDAVRAVMTATLTKGQSPAEALAGLSTFDPRTSRAYVYLGTATAWPIADGDPVAGAPALYAIIARLAATGRAAPAGILYDRLRVLTGETALANPGLRAELMLFDADYQARLSARNRERPAQEAIDKIAQSIASIEKMSLPDDLKKELRAALLARSAVLEMASENYARAQELFADVRQASSGQGDSTGEASAAYMVAIAQERQRQWAAARQTLLRVQADLANTSNAIGLVTVTTSLAYVSLPLSMFPDVLGHLRLAIQASAALGIQVLSETLVQALDIGKAMAQMGAVADLAQMARSLAGIVGSDTHLAEPDRKAIAAVFTLMQETAEVLQAKLPPAEREAKLAPLVETAQSNELTRSLGLDAWILGASAPAGTRAEGDTETQRQEDAEDESQ